MADNTTELKILITSDATSAVDGAHQAGDAVKDLGLKTDELAKEVGVINVSAEEASAILDSTGDSAEQAGGKVEDGGKKAGASADNHMKLRRIMGELNRICPGLGEVFELLAESHRGAGVAAEGEAAANVTLAASFEEVIVSMGPLVIAMLAIEAVMKYWDMYKDKVEAAAQAQEEACKRIVEATHQARAAVKELDEAMHPEKKNLAGQDEENLKKQQNDLQNTYERQKALNKTNEDKELAGAGTPAEKDAIKKRFEVLDTQLDDWRDKQKAAVEGAMVGTMQAQLAKLKEEQDKLIEKSKIPYQHMKDNVPGGAEEYQGIQTELKKNADEAKDLRGKLDELTGQQSTDAGNAAFKSETNREVAAAKGEGYQAPGAGYNVPGPSAASVTATEALGVDQQTAKAIRAGKNVAQNAVDQMLQDAAQIAGHQVTLQQAMTVMSTGANNIGAFMNQVARLTDIFSQLNPQGLNSIQSRLNQLEATVGGLSANHY